MKNQEYNVENAKLILEKINESSRESHHPRCVLFHPFTCLSTSRFRLRFLLFFHQLISHLQCDPSQHSQDTQHNDDDDDEKILMPHTCDLIYIQTSPNQLDFLKPPSHGKMREKIHPHCDHRHCCFFLFHTSVHSLSVSAHSSFSENISAK